MRLVGHRGISANFGKGKVGKVWRQTWFASKCSAEILCVPLIFIPFFLSSFLRLSFHSYLLLDFLDAQTGSRIQAYIMNHTKPRTLNAERTSQDRSSSVPQQSTGINSGY